MNKTILVTGATDGIGKLLAYKLAGENHSLYLHGRSEEKLTHLISDIHSQTNNENIFPYVADFSDLDSVKFMSQKVNNDLESLDVIINNAGIFKTAQERTSAGFDMRFAVNYIAPYLLTNAILPLLKQSEAPRVINLSSAAQASVSMDVFKGNIELGASEAYAQSKLALTMWSFDLADKNSDITVIAVNPGSLLNTKMANEAYGQHWSSADKGRDILYDLALGEKYKDESGKYFDNDSGDFGYAHADAYDEGKIQELINTTEKIINGRI